MRRVHHQRGWVSVMALTAMTVLVLICLGVSSMALQNVTRSQQDQKAMLAFQAAQAALDYEISQAYGRLSGSGGFRSSSRDIDEDLEDIAPGATGTVEVTPTNDPKVAWVTSTATLNGVTKSVRTMLYSRNVGIWNNAIFGGTGAAGRSINGNVDIRGSVHCLGEGEYYSDLNGNGRWDAAEAFTDRNRNGVWDPGEAFVDANGDGVWSSAEPYNDTNRNGAYDPPLTETDLNSTMGGTAYIGNNYSGMPAALEAMVPAAPRINNIEQLGTEVRVKHGRVSINGSAGIGSNSIIDGGTSKNTVDGVFVSDGFTGNQGASSVFSDNGTSNSYDLSHLGINFPVLSGLGAEQYRDSGGTVWANQEAYLDARSLTVNVAEIKASTAAFSFGPDAYGNRISFTPAAGANPAVLNVTGIVRFAGDLQIGAKDTIRYRGNGTLFGKGNINIDGNLLPAAGETFPTTARIGVIAKQNLNLATGNGSSQLSMAGAFYAQGRIVSAKQNQIAGTFVANFFDLGTNVPNIYQVPTLIDNMPPAMPGDNNYFSLKVRTWRERD